MYAEKGKKGEEGGGVENVPRRCTAKDTRAYLHAHLPGKKKDEIFIPRIALLPVLRYPFLRICVGNGNGTSRILVRTTNRIHPAVLFKDPSEKLVTSFFLFARVICIKSAPLIN